MSYRSIHLVTQLLDAVAFGDPGAKDRLWRLVYGELRMLATARLADERPGGIQPTTLVHEAYLRLFADADGHYSSRRHFFGAAAQAMRRILVDDARKRGALKRGRGVRPAVLESEPATLDVDAIDLLAMDEALEKLQAALPRAAEVVHLRYFAGLTINQTAESMGIAPRTVDAEWNMARAWLHRALADGSE